MFESLTSRLGDVFDRLPDLDLHSREETIGDFRLTAEPKTPSGGEVTGGRISKTPPVRSLEEVG